MLAANNSSSSFLGQFLNVTDLSNEDAYILEMDSKIIDHQTVELVHQYVQLFISKNVISLAILRYHTFTILDHRFLPIIGLMNKELVITGANDLEDVSLLKDSQIQDLVITGAHCLKELPPMRCLKTLVLTGAHCFKLLHYSSVLEEVTITGAENFDIESISNLRCKRIVITGLPNNRPDYRRIEN